MNISFSRESLSTIYVIGEFVYKKNSLETLTLFLSHVVCPSGELARIHVAKLDNDGLIRTASSFGYATDSRIDELEIPFGSVAPIPDVLRAGVPLVLNKRRVFEKYKDFVDVDPRSSWESIAIVPTLSVYTFVFRLQSQITDQVSTENYFRLIGNLLSLHDSVKNSDHFGEKYQISLTSHNVSAPLAGAPLTPRQTIILNLIREGKTNAEISRCIGYSESLVKQETIKIYSKLQIEGRKFLVKTI